MDAKNEQALIDILAGLTDQEREGIRNKAIAQRVATRTPGAASASVSHAEPQNMRPDADPRNLPAHVIGAMSVGEFRAACAEYDGAKETGTVKSEFARINREREAMHKTQGGR